MKPVCIIGSLSLCLLALSICWAAPADSRIKDIAAFEGIRDNQLSGLGLVVGLDGTGDKRQTVFSTQMLANMLERGGITVSALQLRVKNIAAVMVTALLPPFARKGSRIDVTVSSIGDAENIQGGVLIMTPLTAANSQIYVTAQGQIALGGFSASSGRNSVQSGHPTVGRIPNGGLVEKEVAVDFAGRKELTLVLNNSDLTNATRAVRTINDSVGKTVAAAMDGRTISIKIPEEYAGRVVEYMALVENAKMDVDVAARVEINEKTGTIVLGKDVKISSVSIIHGNLSLQVGTLLDVSQPTPYSLGKTTVVPQTTITAQESQGKAVTLKDGATVEEVVQSLNAIGATPRDIIAILQAIKAAGALQAQLEII